MDNKTLMKKFEAFAARMGIQKDAGGVLSLDTANFDALMPRQAVEELISLTRNQNEWLSQLSTYQRQQSAGTVPVMDLNEPVTEYVGENDGTKVTTRPETRRVSYACKKFKSEWYVTYEDLMEAAAAGISNFEAKLTQDFATAIGNDLANIVVNGDTTLNPNTRTNRMLRAVDGLRKKADSGNVFNAASKTFGQGIFAAMEDLMPDRFANDPNLQWLYNRRVETNWNNSLTNVNTTERMRSALGDRALTSQIMTPPLGRRQNIIPQLSSSMGLAGIAPTSVSDETTYIQAVLTTLVTAAHIPTAALGVGRKFKITLVATGAYEICTGFLDTTLRINTTGLLGQSSVSTTASDYTVEVYDETELYLCNPKSIIVVHCMEMRSYRQYNKDYDRWEITTYHMEDVLVPVPESIVKFKRVAVPPIETWT